MPLKKLAALFTILITLALSAAAQELGAIATAREQIRQLETLERSLGPSPEAESLNSNFLAARRAQLRALLEKRVDALRNYRLRAGAILSSAEKVAVDNSIKRLEEELTYLENSMRGRAGANAPSGGMEIPTPDARAAAIGPGEGTPVATAVENNITVTDSTSIPPPGQQPAPRFLLSHPASGRTDLPTEDFKLSWTPARWAKSFTVEVREDSSFGSAGAVILETITGQSSYKVPKDKLKPGVRYFWRVTADCDPTLAACPPGGTVTAANAPFSFNTIRQVGFFNYLSARGFSLQRVVSGDDESEGATFSFLRTFGKKTVYATDFALIWDSKEAGAGNTRYSFESSVEGHLTSDESAAEDALRFAAGARIINRFGHTGLNGLHSTFSGKLETDQSFDTKKLYFEALETPTALNLFIGRYSGEVNDPVQFRWRPFFGFQAGHTIKRGGAALPEETVLRMIPRARLDLKLNFISRALSIPRTLLFADDTFYYLPLEHGMRTPNFLASGLEFDFTPNFGLSFNYKNGRTAPKFDRVHTFGGALTIRFGKNEQ